MKDLVTITNGGITQTVSSNELPFYTRAGYSVVAPEPVEPEPTPTPEPEPVEPEQPVKKVKK